MRRTFRFCVTPSITCVRPVALSIAAALFATGCGHAHKTEVKSVTDAPTVQILKPPIRDITRVVGQPSFIESYERTSIYPKLTGYIEKWNVDIGDKVKKGQPLATLYVPELVEDFSTKKATVELDTQKVELAQKTVEVAKADVKSAQASLAEAQSILAKFNAEVERWDSEVKRLTQEVDRGVVDPQVLLESTNQFKANTAAREAAKATIAKAEADVLSREATLAKAMVDVGVARADLSVAKSEEKRIEAWVGYITLPAPFDGIIVTRNANTLDFVLPSTGDPTAMEHSPHQSPSGAAPIYVVDRTDIVRIFVDIPEQDANYVQIGSKARVLVRAYRDDEIPASVTRTSWALEVKSRTLRAEIDLPNPNSQLLPGMYAYAWVDIKRPGVRALPKTSLVTVADQTYFWMYQNGHAHRVEVQTAIADSKWVEVTNRLVPAEGGGEGTWVPIDGTEEVILGDTSVLTEGTAVVLAAAGDKEKAASTPAHGGPH